MDRWRATFLGLKQLPRDRHKEEMQAVADALSLLANIVMAWNTAQMQGIFDQWNRRRVTAIPPELIGASRLRISRASICAACIAFRLRSMPNSCCRRRCTKKRPYGGGKLHSFRRKMHGQKGIRNPLYYSRVQTSILEL